MRTHKWLEEQFEQLLRTNFVDLAIKNPIYVRFGRRTSRRLGSISFERIKEEPEKVSVITINGYFRSEVIPKEIVHVTLAHELIHYLHGFNSKHNQIFDFPHKGSIVNKELRHRGFSNELKFQRQWLKEKWEKIIHRQKMSSRI